MRNDQIFVLLLVILLPMSGCFDGAVGDAEGTDDATSGTTVINNYYNNTTGIQDRTWYSSADIVNIYWNDGQDVNQGYSRCLEYGPSYNSSTGEYLGEECKETGYPDELSDWNNTMCTQRGGVMTGAYTYPTCSIVVKTINTNVGEALILYEMQHITILTTCNGVVSSIITQIGGYYGGEDNAIVPGSALSCDHEITVTQSYVKSSSSYLNDMKIWSIVYAIQDTTVV